MMMDIGEIQRQYKYAKDRKKCVSILAELNCSSKNEILNIVHSAEEKKGSAHVWNPSAEQKAIIERLEELDAMIKPLEDEYRRTAAALMKIGGADAGRDIKRD